MTREEFVLNVDTWSDLFHACYEINSNICSDIYSATERDDDIYETIHDNDDEWYDLRDLLSEIPTGYNYYEKGDGYMEWYGVDDDFEAYKQNVLDDGDSREVWDIPSVAIPEENEDGVEDEPIEDEDFTPLELLNSCNDEFVGLLDDITKKREEEMSKELEFRERPTPFMVEF